MTGYIIIKELMKLQVFAGRLPVQIYVSTLLTVCRPAYFPRENTPLFPLFSQRRCRRAVPADSSCLMRWVSLPDYICSVSFLRCRGRRLGAPPGCAGGQCPQTMRYELRRSNHSRWAPRPVARSRSADGVGGQFVRGAPRVVTHPDCARCRSCCVGGDAPAPRRAVPADNALRTAPVE